MLRIIPNQEDYDNDGVGYICDQLIDFDKDGYADYTFYEDAQLRQKFCSNNTTRACTQDSQCGVCSNDPARACAANNECENGGTCGVAGTCTALLDVQRASTVLGQSKFEGARWHLGGASANILDST